MTTSRKFTHKKLNNLAGVLADATTRAVELKAHLVRDGRGASETFAEVQKFIDLCDEAHRALYRAQTFNQHDVNS